MTDYPIKWHKTSHGYDDDMLPIRERESFILIYPTGAIEGWRAPSMDGPEPMWAPTGYYGGIEVHSKTPLRDGHRKNGEYCEWTRGDCYHDGSSLAFDQIQYYFDNPGYLFTILREWAETNLPKQEADR